MRAILIICLALLAVSMACAEVIVDIPMDQQIDIGSGEALSDVTAFHPDPGGGFARLNLTAGSGGGGWYFAPTIDFMKAGYGPSLDLSGEGIKLQFEARYFQGDGNTNPYADCGIWVLLMDANGRSHGLGGQYGPVHPDPPYPAWQTCIDDMTLEGWPDDEGFDLTQVTAIQFYGTDWAGVGNDFVDFRKLLITNPIVHNPIPIQQAKNAEDGEQVEITGIVSASFPRLAMYYVEDPQRVGGIQVRDGDTPSVGSGVFVQGTVWTDGSTGEVRIASERRSRTVAGSVSPLFLNSRSLGGGPMGRQCGVVGGSGLNNIGLLARVSGVVTNCGWDNSWAYVSDGHYMNDGNNDYGVRVDLSGIPFHQRPVIIAGQMATVTGVVSIYTGDDGEKHPTIWSRQASDFLNAFRPGNEPKLLRAAVINFDPVCPGYGGARTHVACGFNDPHALIEGYTTDLFHSSGWWCRYQVASWYDADYHPAFEDGFQYGADDYVYAWQHRDTVQMHSGTTDYMRLLTDPTYPHNQPTTLAQRIANDEIDEVFALGAPYGFAGWEAAMAGPSPFFVNGGSYEVPEALRNFVVMGFNYERGVDCMLEDFLHRTECVMSRVYPSPEWWLPTYPPSNNWERFRMYDQRAPGQAAVGICHFAPNSESDYDWGNTRYVWSTCDDWLYNWPNLVGDVTRRFVSCDEWGGGDMRLHHIWWLDHLPQAQGINDDGRQNNWWKYTCDFNNYPESR